MINENFRKVLLRLWNWNCNSVASREQWSFHKRFYSCGCKETLSHVRCFTLKTVQSYCGCCYYFCCNVYRSQGVSFKLYALYLTVADPHRQQPSRPQVEEITNTNPTDSNVNNKSPKFTCYELLWPSRGNYHHL